MRHFRNAKSNGDLILEALKSLLNIVNESIVAFETQGLGGVDTKTYYKVIRDIYFVKLLSDKYKELYN